MRDMLSTPRKSPGKWRGHNGSLYLTCLKLLSPCRQAFPRHVLISYHLMSWDLIPLIEGFLEKD